ncbi:glucose 1-dehydrogenase [Amycolatopsis rhabdoformis]|uniref:Glucose 1-dehydrogenase n=1 Tax=Amycolatopsis rhabdoformis TaxID=1448059 RepID=A0ABZ1IKW3_9PSEU|nr:glucose 1-dehydrogenase [Amycolatopsis rhabdoformis]WSE34135.1 glucose 1-dehydrogenase [Amycolatopsis rhabdoformis]
MTVAASLTGLTTLVTGAGRGLGAGIARACAAGGADVVLVSRSAEEIERGAAEIRAAGGRARAIACDVTDLPRFAALVAEAGPIDVLVNNAGTNVPQPFTDVGPEIFDRVLDLNLRSLYFATQAVVRAMIERGRGGSIVNVSSQMGHVGAPNRSAYCASKHAVEGLTKALAVELGPHRIRVNSIAPTYVETSMTAPFLADPGFLADTLHRIPLGRLGRVEDVTGAVVFLAGPGAGLITGTSVVIDGGYTAH